MEDWQEHRDDLDALFFSERDLHARGSELHSDAYDFVERWSRYRQVGFNRTEHRACERMREPLCEQYGCAA